MSRLVSFADTVRNVARRGMALVLGVVVMTAANRAEADDLTYRPSVDGVITAAGAGFWVLSGAILVDRFAPDECTWCETNQFDEAIRDEVRWSDPTWASRLSDLGAYVLAPAAAATTLPLASRDAGAHGSLWVDLGVVAESVIAAGCVQQIFKLTIGRERPRVHAIPPDERGEGVAEDNLSFYSGHASISFALATSAGTVASIRGYRLAPVVWGAGLGVAALTVYMRLAADDHYATDVVAGAFMGGLAGVTVPLLHRRRRSSELALAAGPRSIALLGRF